MVAPSLKTSIRCQEFGSRLQTLERIARRMISPWNATWRLFINKSQQGRSTMKAGLISNVRSLGVYRADCRSLTHTQQADPFNPSGFEWKWYRPRQPLFSQPLSTQRRQDYQQNCRKSFRRSRKPYQSADPKV